MTFAAAGTPREVPSPIGGYGVLQAESLAALSSLLERHPHFHAPGATIVVHELLTLPGM